MRPSAPLKHLVRFQATCPVCGETFAHVLEHIALWHPFSAMTEHEKDRVLRLINKGFELEYTGSLAAEREEFSTDAIAGASVRCTRR